MSLADARPSSPADMAAHLAASNQAALRALKAGDPRAAQAILREALALDPSAIPLQLNLAAACRALDDADGAMAAVEAALKADPRSFMALLMKASLLERKGERRLAGAAYGLALAQAPPLERLDPPTQKAVEHARELAAGYGAELADHLGSVLGRTGSGSSTKEGARLSAFVDRLTGRRRIFHQQPMQFAYPGLPSIEFYDREHFPWLPEVEAASQAVLKEFLAVMQDTGSKAEFVPYVDYPDGVPLDQWAELNKSTRWSSYHLYANGAALTDHCARVPATIAALKAAEQPQVPGRSPAAMFSVLQPRTRIPPHTGVSNTRLVAHLPLVIPEGCAFRVGSETRLWRFGQAWVFDDTIDHEARNDSEDWRAILIFDVWSPFLSPAEREAVVEVMNAMDAFHGVKPEGEL